MSDNKTDRLAALVEPAVNESGLDLEQVTVRSAGRRPVVRVVADKDGGVTADELAAASRAVSRALDASEALGAGPYTLEVTSPGVDRPLTEPRHWRRAATRLVRAPLHRADGTAGELYGRVVGADAAGVIVDQDGDQHRYSYEELGVGTIEVELRRPRTEARRGGDREDVR